MEKRLSFLQKTYGNQLRIRVSGFCRKENKLLMVQIKREDAPPLWLPPGGALQYKESIETALKREFLEEATMPIQVGRFLFLHQFIQIPLHAVELFFHIVPLKKEIFKGIDPELPLNQQIISQVRWMSYKEIDSLPKEQVHTVFHNKKVETFFHISSHFFSSISN